jgi:TatD DNase family protein
VLSDSHLHLTDERFAPDRDAVIRRAREAGLRALVTVVARLGDGDACADLAAANDDIHFAAGVHPHEAKHWTPAVAADLRRLAARPKFVALGEIGLDYHYNHSPPREQRAAFREQILLARDLAVPIVVHTREAWDDTFAILKDENAAAAGGVFHCFSGGPREAERALGIGFALSFAGPVTFRNAGPLAEAAALVPSDRYLIETDAPYLSPHPVRGQRNEPARVAHVASRLAALRGTSPGAVGEEATRNLERAFRIAVAR